ncbi:MAG: hypothetical protein KAU46_09690 [Candidatus Aminicenantes bacterium]|nr:hypothetical protein [Candidatus Aminicenantes bacterium]
MLKKEFREVLVQTLLFVLATLLMPVFVIVTTIVSDDPSYFGVFFVIFQVGLLFWAMFMGASIFSFDRGQRGIEYLLSLPYSRLQIIGLKIIPRLSAVVIFYLLYLILYSAGGEYFLLMLFTPFTAIYFVLFLIALSLSVISDNFVVLSAASVFSLFVYLVLFYLAYVSGLLIRGIPHEEFGLTLSDFFAAEPGWGPGFILVIALVLILPFLIAFLLSFRKFDVRPEKVHNIRYLKYFAPLLALGLLISLLFAYMGTSLDEYTDYYLTENHKLIEIALYKKIKIHDKDTVSKVEYSDDYFWPNLEEKEYVYDLGYSRRVLRINTSDFTSDILYETPKGKRMCSQASKYDQTIALLERSKDFPGIQLVLIDELSKKITRISFEHEWFREYFRPFIFGTDKIGDKRFWLICSGRSWKHPLLRLWEDGRIDNIGNSRKFPCYVNRMLITYSEQALIVSKLTKNSFQTIKEIPEGKDLHFGSRWSMNLNRAPLKEMRTRSMQKYYRLDLENLEIEELGEWKGQLQRSYTGGFYLIERDRPNKLIKIHLLKEGKLELLKSFKGFDGRSWKNTFRVFKSGVIIKKGSKVKVYAFPDLKELKFKGF